VHTSARAAAGARTAAIFKKTKKTPQKSAPGFVLGRKTKNKQIPLDGVAVAARTVPSSNLQS
jgi:hypothetical protein